MPWTDSILVPGVRWGDRGNYETWALQFQSGVHLRKRSVHWLGAVPFCAAYLPKSPVNTRATACRVRDVCLRENRLEQAQTLLRAHYTRGDERGNRSNDKLDGWVDQ